MEKGESSHYKTAADGDPLIPCTFSLQRSLLDALNELAFAEGKTRSQLLRSMIVFELERRRPNE